MTQTDLMQDIYLVQTDAKQKKVPKDWIKSGGTKVGFAPYQLPRIINRMVSLFRDGRSTP